MNIDLNIDVSYLQYFDICYRQGLSERGGDGRRRAITFSYRNDNFEVSSTHFGFRFSLSSPVYRSAFLVLASYLRDGPKSIYTFKYFDRFCKEANLAIITRSLPDLVYSSWLITIYSLVRSESPDSIQLNCLQFCRSVHALFQEPGGIADVELAAVERTWQSMMEMMNIFLRVRSRDRHCRDRVGELMVNDQKLLDQSECLLAIDGLGNGRPLETDLWHRKLKTFSVFLSRHVDRLLFNVRNSGQLEGHGIAGPIRRQLINQIDKYTDLILRDSNMIELLNNIETSLANFENPWLPDCQFTESGRTNPWNRDIAMQCFTALLVKEIISPAEYTIASNPLLYHAARAICLIVRDSLNYEGSMERGPALYSVGSLMWAGTILTQSTHPEGEKSRSFLAEFNSKCMADDGDLPQILGRAAAR